MITRKMYSEMNCFKSSNLWLKVIGISCIAVAFILLLSVVIMFFMSIYDNTSSVKKNNSQSNTYNKVYETISKDDYNHISLTNKKDSIELNVIVQRLIKNNEIVYNNYKYLNEKQESLVQDIRQETNNNINKLNMWLSFWIGMLAVFGVLSPIVAEYRYKTSNKDEMNKLKNEIYSTLDKYTLQKCTIELEGAVNALILSHDNRIISGFVEEKTRDKALDIILSATLNSLKTFLGIINPLTHKVSENEKIDIQTQKAIVLQVLISLFSFIQKLKYIKYNEIRIRDIDNIQDELRLIIRSVVNDFDLDNSYNKIYNFINKLSKICSDTN